MDRVDDMILWGVEGSGADPKARGLPKKKKGKKITEKLMVHLTDIRYQGSS